MKKLISVLVCLMLTMMLFVACGKEDDSDSKENNDSDKDVIMDVAATADALMADIEFVDEMTEIASMDFFVAVFSVDADDVVSQKTYVSSGATAERVAVVECKDADAAKRVKSIFEAYTADLSSQYADYTPSECEKLDNAVIEVHGKYVVMCVSNDNDTAKKTIEGQVK